MKLLILYRRETDSGRSVEEFIHDFQQLHPGVNLEVISPDTKEGADLARLYDISNPPAIVATKDDGAPLNIWQGEQLPLMNDVASYVAS